MDKYWSFLQFSAGRLQKINEKEVEDFTAISDNLQAELVATLMAVLDSFFHYKVIG